MSKTAEEIGLIVGGIALAATGLLATEGIIAIGASPAMMTAMISIGLTTALTGVGIALRPTNNSVTGPNTISFSNGPAPRRVINGQCQTAGVLTYASFPPSQNLVDTNQYLHLVYTLTANEISSFDAVIIDGTIYNFGVFPTNPDLCYNPQGTDTLWHVYPDTAIIDFYWQHIFFEFDFGRGDWFGSQPFPNLTASDSSWNNSSCKQQGCAKVHVICRADTSWTALFPAGQIPNIQFLVTGKKLVDPRIVTAWQPSAGYVKYNWIADNYGVIFVQTNASGTSGATRPNFEGVGSFPATVADGGCSWTSQFGQTMTPGSLCVSNGLSSNPQGNLLNNCLVNDAWLKSQAYSAGDIIEAPVGYLQLVATAGTTGANYPGFSLTLGGTTSDSGVSWVCLGRSSNAISPSNPALVLYDYLQDTDYGMSAAANTIDVSSVIAAANICEEGELIIWNADNTVVYEDRYSCNGMFDFSSTPGDVLIAICASMAGWAVPPGDLWHIFAGSFQTPTVAIGDTDLRGALKGDFRLSRREVCNSVKGRYVPAFLPVNPAAAATMSQLPGIWQAQPFPAYQANGMAGKPDYLNSEDGGQIIWLDLQLDFTTSLWTAQRLAKIALMRTRFQQTLTLACKITALQLEAGDTLYFTHARWGILGQTFEITQAGITLDSEGSKDGAPALGVDLMVRQTDVSVYEFQGPTSASDYGEYSPFGVTGVMTGVE
jgi:hypothetical protein